MNIISTTLPPEVVAALAPAVAAVAAEARAGTTDGMYSTVSRAAKATVRFQGTEYRPGVVAIIGQAFPDRQRAFAEDLYDGRRVDLDRPEFAVTATEDEDQDEDYEDCEHVWRCTDCGGDPEGCDHDYSCAECGSTEHLDSCAECGWVRNYHTHTITCSECDAEYPQ